jgi:hypothetical protein
MGHVGCIGTVGVMDYGLFWVSYELGYIFCRHLNGAVHRTFPTGGGEAVVDCTWKDLTRDP